MKSDDIEQKVFIFVPEMTEFFTQKRKNVSLMWIPVPVSILFRDEFGDLCTLTKYVYLTLMLACGLRGSNRLPFNIKYLANIAGVNRRTMSNGIDELLCANMLTKTERETEKEEKKEKTPTDRQTDEPVVVGWDSVNFSEPKPEAENQTSGKSNLLKIVAPANIQPPHLSRFTLEECLKYARQSDGVKNPNALATSLFQTGNADAFIMAMLYPVEAKEADAQHYGAPIKFTAEPCAVCYGAKMADTDGKGYRQCVHCKNERGKSSGFEPVRREQPATDK